MRDLSYTVDFFVETTTTAFHVNNVATVIAGFRSGVLLLLLWLMFDDAIANKHTSQTVNIERSA
jgi:hypothetical protein